MNEIVRLREENEELRERVRQLEDILRPASIVVPHEWRLSPQEDRVFRHLVSREIGTKTSVYSALFSDRIDEWPGEKIMDVIISRIREKTRDFGVMIETVWGVGWRLHDRNNYTARGQAEQ